MPEVETGELMLDADAVFKKGSAICPNDDAPMKLLGFSSETSRDGTSVTVELGCPKCIRQYEATFRTLSRGGDVLFSIVQE